MSDRTRIARKVRSAIGERVGGTADGPRISQGPVYIRVHSSALRCRPSSPRAPRRPASPSLASPRRYSFFLGFNSTFVMPLTSDCAHADAGASGSREERSYRDPASSTASPPAFPCPDQTLDTRDTRGSRTLFLLVSVPPALPIRRHLSSTSSNVETSLRNQSYALHYTRTMPESALEGEDAGKDIAVYRKKAHGSAAHSRIGRIWECEMSGRVTNATEFANL